jgi:NADPH-dependent 2,4-dienoyl-CoA reductase/sulfur reductase-like enzyme
MYAMAFNLFIWVYQIIQWILDKVFSPTPPPPNAHLRRPKIAVIGAGLTGVSAASHCVGHGFDVTIFEQGSREHLGGIWSVWLPPPLKNHQHVLVRPFSDAVGSTLSYSNHWHGPGVPVG